MTKESWIDPHQYRSHPLAHPDHTIVRKAAEMMPPDANYTPEKGTSPLSAYESVGKSALRAANCLWEAWIQDARRLQEALQCFVNRRLEKDLKAEGDLVRCSSPGALIDLQGRAWGEAVADYAELIQSGLCWFEDALQHASEETAKANGWPYPWPPQFAVASRNMS